MGIGTELEESYGEKSVASALMETEGDIMTKGNELVIIS